MSFFRHKTQRMKKAQCYNSIMPHILRGLNLSLGSCPPAELPSVLNQAKQTKSLYFIFTTCLKNGKLTMEVQPPADILNKIADLFGTSVDFLINGLSAEKAQATLKNAELLQQFKQVEELPKEEQNTIIKFVGAYLRDFQTKKANAS